MGKQESLAQFELAGQLFREGRYAESLAILVELNRQHPGSKNILFPLAECLFRVGRLEQASAICSELIAKSGDPKAVSLAERITAAQAPSRAPGDYALSNAMDDVVLPQLDMSDHAGLDALRVDIGEGFSSKRAAKPVEVAPPQRNWIMIGGIAAGVLLFVGVLLLPLFVDSSNKPIAMETPISSDEARVPVLEILDDGQIALFGYVLTTGGYLAFIIVAQLISTFIYYTINLYITLYFLGRLPHDDFKEDVFDIAVVSGIATLMSLLTSVCCIGLFLQIKLLRDKYDFGLTDFLILIATSIVVALLINIVIYCGLALAGFDMMPAVSG
jgi:hypothetical protein